MIHLDSVFNDIGQCQNALKNNVRPLLEAVESEVLRSGHHVKDYNSKDLILFMASWRGSRDFISNFVNTMLTPENYDELFVYKCLTYISPTSKKSICILQLDD